MDDGIRHDSVTPERPGSSKVPKPDDIAIGVIIGRAAEFFDFFVYGIATVLVFPAHVFGFLPDKTTAMISSFGLFCVAFISRPVGSMIFMAIDRLYGRPIKLTIALFILGGSTAAISFLPSHEDIGLWSLALLCLFRLGQGFALGGAWDGLSSLLSLGAPHERQGWYAMLPQLGAPIGFALASGLFAFLTMTLSPTEFLNWGWRYPFFVAFAINVVALFARLRLVLTREFADALDSRALRSSPVREVWGTYRWNIILGAMVPLASFTMLYVVTILPLGWATLKGNRSQEALLLIQSGASAFGVVGIIASGVLADKMGRRRQLTYGALGIAAFALFGSALIGLGTAGDAIFLALGFLLFGFSFGQASGALSSAFSQEHRYTGAALSSDLAWFLGAGLAPVVSLWLSERFGVPFFGYYIVSGCVCALVALRLGQANLPKAAPLPAEGADAVECGNSSPSGS